MLFHSPPHPLPCLLIPYPPPNFPCRPISLISRPALANHTASKPGGGVKKVTGVGGTTYEISVWADLHGALRGVFGTPWSLDYYYLTELVNMNNHRPMKQNCYSLLQHTKHRAVWFSLLSWPSDLNERGRWLILGTASWLDTGMSIKSDSLLYFGYFSTQNWPLFKT